MAPTTDKLVPRVVTIAPRNIHRFPTTIHIRMIVLRLPDSSYRHEGTMQLFEQQFARTSPCRYESEKNSFTKIRPISRPGAIPDSSHKLPLSYSLANLSLSSSQTHVYQLAMASFGRVSLYYDPLHRERCIGLLDNGHPCPQDVDLKWREIAHTQLQLLQDMTDLTARESCLNSITKHLLCDSHRRILVRSTKHRYVPDPPLLTVTVTNDIFNSDTCHR